MDKNNRCYVDLHVIQTVPPSCVNRDDTGSPKTAQYGGVTRARVSSQSWKRAMRLMFPDCLEEGKVGKRTKRIVGLVADAIQGKNAALNREKAEKLAADALDKAGLKIKSAEKGTDAIFFMSIAQAAALAELAVEGSKEKKDYQEALKASPSADMALFGRMVANDPSLNYDAAAQVAHSISTHEVHNEFDYFTAVDDCAPEDNAGAGHVGTSEFNSSTLYRYATVNVMELLTSLGKADTASAVRGFVEAFICSMPTGKQNSFANRTYPDFVYVTIRHDQPVNLVGAFEKPIRSTEGYAALSVTRLREHAEKTYENFSCSPDTSLCVGEGFDGLAEKVSLKELLDKLEALLADEVDR